MAGESRVLAGDVGGTNTRIAVVEIPGFRIVEERTYASREHPGLVELAETFAGDAGETFEAACFGVAGPVRKGRAELTNLPWVVDRMVLEEALEKPVAVVNDLEAMAWSLDGPGSDQVATIHEGAVGSGVEGNRALIAPGTGLGQAGATWDGAGHRPFATEGGHADFAPADQLEWDLRAVLAARHGHVSWERVVSGPGLVAIHRFLDARGTTGPGLSCVVDELADDDPAAGPAITRAGHRDSCPICRRTVDLFCRLLGREAGNLALKLLATGGVWIGGGIAPSLVSELRSESFLAAFLGKGRMRKLLEAIPVRVILDPEAGLRGAARVAAGRLAGD